MEFGQKFNLLCIGYGVEEGLKKGLGMKHHELVRGRLGSSFKMATNIYIQ